MEGIAEDSLKECIWIIDGFVFLREFNPRLPDYDIAAVERYFFTDRMQRATEFLAWRKYFWPGQNRCDRCCIRLLSECVYAPGAAECGNCTLTGEQCAFTYETESPSNTQDQLPPDPFSPANPGPNTGGSMPPAAAQDKGKGIMNFSCVTCTHNNYDSCDMRPSLNYGCTNCRKLDVACQVYDSNAQSQILTPRPDGLLPPLCCDGCIHPPGGIHECSWRHIGSDESLPCDKCVVDDIMCTYMGVQQRNIQGFHTHYSRTQHLPYQRPANQQEIYANPRASLNASRADGVQDVVRAPLVSPPQPIAHGSARLASFPVLGNVGEGTVQPNQQSGFADFQDFALVNDVLSGLPNAAILGPSSNQPTYPVPTNFGVASGLVPVPAQNLAATAEPSSSQAPVARESAPAANGSRRRLQRLPAGTRDRNGKIYRSRRQPCRLCASYQPKSYNYRRCNWEIDGDVDNPTPGDSQMGCTTCRNYGLICVVEDGIALPPRPEVAVLSRTAFSMCDPCRANKTRCDRQRACNACITRNTPNECVGGTGRGTFTRGAGHGTELYTYVSIMGGGLNGLQDPVKFNAVYDQPADIHLQYIQWLEGGPLPVPPGYAQPYETPPRPDIRLRALPFPLPVMSAQSPGQARTPAQAHTPAGPAQQPVEQPVEQLMQQPIVPQPIVPQPFQPATPIDILDAGEELADPGITSNMQDYENAWSTAKINASNGQVIDLAKLRVSLREALFSGIPAKQSIAAQPYLNLNEKLPEARPVVIPHGVDENEVALLGLGARTIFNLGQDLQFPPSPAPTGRIFDIVGVNDIIGDVTLAPYDPEYTDLRLISAEQPNHPNPSSIPALQTISSLSLFNTVADDDIFCSEIKLDGDFCLDMTRRQCEDLSHDAARPLAVCDECNDMSRARFEKHLASISIMMRAYACFTCAMAEITNPHNYNGRRFNVWGLPPNVFRDNEEFSSRNRGPPLPLTGCHCASKLLDRRLCTPHRLEHYLAIRSKAQDMRDFVLATLGRMVCPFCFLRAGADRHNFVDQNGVEFPRHAYVCLACCGIVVVDSATHAAGISESIRLMSGNAVAAVALSTC